MPPSISRIRSFYDATSRAFAASVWSAAFRRFILAPEMGWGRGERGLRASREPFGKAGLTVAVLALVLAMIGGAYAAGALSTQQKKEVEKIARKVAGTTAPTGPAGAAGKDGAAGTPGTSGADGKSVEIGGTASGCPAGGVSVQVAGEASTRGEICNGKDGETGFTETLPSGKTETGAWAGTAHEIGPLPISFDIPLAAPVSEADTKIVPFGSTAPPECENSEHPGTASVENPEARPGFLCVYVWITPNSAIGGIEPTGFNEAVAHMAAGTTGAFVILETTSTADESHGTARGTWAVTAP